MSGPTATIYADHTENVKLLEGSFRNKGYFVRMGLCQQTSHMAKLVQRIFSPDRTAVLPVPLVHEHVLVRRPLEPHLDLDQIAMLAGCEDTQPLEIWHLRLGHLNQAAIQQLTSRATGLRIGVAKPHTLSMNCESCLRGSQHRNISHSRGHPASRKLEHIWADIKGPLLDKDIYGFRYFVVFVDEFSRYTVELPMISRSHLCDAYKLFEARAERVSGTSVVNLHADGEFISDDLRLHLRNRGIALLLTQPYAPEMNGLAERVIRTIIEHASAMLWAASLPIGFWSSAVKCAVFLTNRSPHSALHGEITPYESWFGVKPNLGFLKVFGCRAAAHVPDELRRKGEWTSKSSPNCVFIGYSDTENLFELWDVDKGVVIQKRDVVFWEHELGHPKLKSPLPHGVSILPAVAGELVQSVSSSLRDASCPVPSTAPPVSLPLLPRTGRQSIDRLSSEPTNVQSGNYRFIAERLPADIQEKVSNIRSAPLPPIQFAPIETAHFTDDCFVDPTSVLTQTAYFVKKLDILDVEFMDQLSLEHWTEPLDTAMDIATGEVVPLEAYQIPCGSSPTLYVPYVEKDIPQSFKQAMTHPLHDMWKAAMDRELAALHKAQTWELVDLPKGRKAFPNRWVFAFVRGPKVAELQETLWREQQDGVLTPQQVLRLQEMSKSSEAVMGKARLVARGDLQKEGIDYEQTYAPGVKFVSLRLILTWAARNRMKMEHWDIVSAFLHGEIDMEVYMQQPQGFNDGTNRVCLLRKAIYGLHQSARQFYIKLDQVLGDIGYRRLGADWAIWTNPTSGAIIAAHVDDMSACGTEQQLAEAKLRISAVLGVKNLGDITRYLGINCTYDLEAGLFHLSQSDYVDRLLDEYGMQNAFTVSTPVLESDKEKWGSSDSSPLDAHQKKKYQALVGSLLYLMHATRPDIAFTVIRLSQFSANPRSCHWDGLKRILRYLKGTRTASLVLGGIPSGEDELIGYFDAAHGDCANRRSTCGYFFLWNGSPLSWCSKVQRTVALSTTEAELMAGTEATKEAIWIKALLDQVCNRDVKCVLRGDNQGSLALAQNPVFHQRTKHIDIRQKFIGEMVKRGKISVQYVHTKEMLADGFTKPIPKDIHWQHMLRLRLHLRPSSISQLSEASKKRKDVPDEHSANQKPRLD